jgi:hypothetical protein
MFYQQVVAALLGGGRGESFFFACVELVMLERRVVFPCKVTAPACYSAKSCKEESRNEINSPPSQIGNKDSDTSSQQAQ